MKFALVRFDMDPVGFKILDVYGSAHEAQCGRYDIIRGVVAKANAARQADFDSGRACRSIVTASEFETVFRIQEVD